MAYTYFYLGLIVYQTGRFLLRSTINKGLFEIKHYYPPVALLYLKAKLLKNYFSIQVNVSYCVKTEYIKEIV